VRGKKVAYEFWVQQDFDVRNSEVCRLILSQCGRDLALLEMKKDAAKRLQLLAE
jgi:hypothetical protein